MSKDEPPDEGWGDLTTNILASEQANKLKVPAGPERAYLIVLAGSRVGTMVRVTDGLKVGRGDAADLRILDDGVSRVHLRLHELADGTVRLEDLGSRNGTLVNGSPVNEAMLADGDKIQLGSTTILKFSYSDQLESEFQQQLFDAAIRDPLTRLFNRRYLMEQLQLEFHFTRRYGTLLTMVMMDLDHFKQINDNYGHPVGDRVLVEVARLMTHVTRAEDLAVRYGGEEFALVCRGMSQEVGLNVANRIRNLVAEEAPVTEHPELRISLSAGVATAPHPAIGGPDHLIAAADKALYEAKQAGRNRVCLFNEPDAPEEEK